VGWDGDGVGSGKLKIPDSGTVGCYKNLEGGGVWGESGTFPGGGKNQRWPCEEM